MRFGVTCSGLGGGLLVGCDSSSTASEATQQPVHSAVLSSPAPLVAVLPDTVDETRPLHHFGSLVADSLVQLNTRRYRLTIQAVADSTRPPDYTPAAAVGPAFAAPSDTAWQAHRVRGHAGTYTFTLCDLAKLILLLTLRNSDCLRLTL